MIDDIKMIYKEVILLQRGINFKGGRKDQVRSKACRFIPWLEQAKHSPLSYSLRLQLLCWKISGFCKRTLA